ncbi:MAG: extracellular solute-binding protein [Candidatus Hydrogenedentes bacterium]|nr:extracellular solute-binding protein [Candidatus Hydrogenedentota bacterium]
MRTALALACLVAAGCGGSGVDVVMVYSPHGPEMLGDYEKKFEADHPGVDVQWIDAGSQEVYNRVRSEKANPRGDVWWGGPSSLFVQAAKEDLLAPYRPVWADAVDDGFKDSQDHWYGTFRSPLAIAYNNQGYAASDVPRTWDELLDPKWNGKLTFREPVPSGTMRTFIGAMILRQENEETGLAWLRRLHGAAEDYTESPQLLFDHLKRNPQLVTVWLMPDIALQRERHGYPLDTVVPPQTPVLTEGIAIIKGAPHPELAKAFYDYVTTQENLVQQAQAYAKMPARSDVDPESLPEWMRNQDIDAMGIDWAHFAQNERRWTDLWVKEVYNAS